MPTSGSTTTRNAARCSAFKPGGFWLRARALRGTAGTSNARSDTRARVGRSVDRRQRAGWRGSRVRRLRLDRPSGISPHGLRLPRLVRPRILCWLGSVCWSKKRAAPGQVQRHAAWQDRDRQHEAGPCPVASTGVPVLGGGFKRHGRTPACGPAASFRCAGSRPATDRPAGSL